MLKFILMMICFHMMHCEQIVNLNVVSYSNLNHYLVKVTQQIYFINDGIDVIEQYTYVENPNNNVINFMDQFDNKLEYKDVGYVHANNITSTKLLVKLNEKVKPKGTYSLICHSVLMDTVKAVHDYIKTDEEHFVKFEANMLYYSLYPTKNYKLYLTFDSANVASVSNYSQVEKNDNKLFYNFTDIKPLSLQMNQVVYKYDKPIFVVNELQRNIHVSMYGKIFIEDNIVLQNRASKFVGHYHEYFADNIPKMLYTFLPSTAENVKFYDVIGNNSFSEIIYRNEDVVLKYKPRYPLFGGWQYTYVIEYYVPLHEYLYFDKELGSYHLQMRAVDHIISDTFIEDATIRISLPQFASVLKVTTPRKFSRQNDEVMHYSLSLFGNPTVVLKGSYVTEFNISSFTVDFSYTTCFALCAAITIIVYIECIFLLYLLCNRYIYSK